MIMASRFYMPAEWEEHQRMLMAWPVSGFSSGEGLREAREAYADTARAIAEFEPVVMLANSDHSGQAREMCGGGVSVLEIEHDDAWIRDNGPTFVLDGGGSLVGVSWNFNAWGLKYPDYALDDTVPEKLCQVWGVPVVKPGIVLEGGSVHTNGRGTVIATEECLLNGNRNPRLGRKEIESVLMEYLGAERVVWLPFGLCDDETDGHVDNVCCFIAENTVLIPWTDDRTSGNYARFERNRRELEARGLSAETVVHPAPTRFDGRELALSYVNFVFANGAVIMPAFGGGHESTDALARDRMRELFPEREIVQLPALPIVKAGGGIHCITQQVPGETPARPRPSDPERYTRDSSKERCF
ncbi:MAG: agmatine deiminase family protein [Synergistaceae bacterium]|jgi:agmatine deiminase|nr:agmatine deiminase family protein [Synergistaceae bacterium]